MLSAASPAAQFWTYFTFLALGTVVAELMLGNITVGSLVLLYFEYELQQIHGHSVHPHAWGRGPGTGCSVCILVSFSRGGF